jgi:hypothetical protein
MGAAVSATGTYCEDIAVNDIFDEAVSSTGILATEEGRRLWTRPCVQRLRAGSAEEGANNRTDFIDGKS